MDYGTRSAVWEFGGGTLSCSHPAVSFKMVRKLQIKGWNKEKGCEREEFLKGNMKCVCFSNTEEITSPGRLPVKYISSPPDLLATNQQNKYDTTCICQAIWELELSHAHFGGHYDGFLPGCGEQGVDNWILWVLGAHEKHVLWKHKMRMGEGEVFQQHLKEPARSAFLHLQIKNTHLRSSSKCVSMPLTPGTEHISRALRKVVHLFTRLLWPPMSFCITNTHTKKNLNTFL